MSTQRPAHPAAGLGLSARLLGLTVVFVMLAEVLIYVPSISRFRKTYLEDQIDRASIAVLAARASPEHEVGRGLAMDLLFHTQAYAISLKTPERRLLMLSREMPPAVDVTVHLGDRMFTEWIAEAFATLAQTRNRIMRVVAAEASPGGAELEVILDETPMREAMYAYSWRILTLSIVISLITAGLVYVSLQWLLVRPIRQITQCIMRFRENPEDETATLPATRRGDEIGLAQRELQVMQQELRAALRQKAHLAALGAAVAKINHDLRNTLATAVLVSDRLAEIDDPEVKRVTPRLVAAIDRAVQLCSRTLDFVQDGKRTLRASVFALDGLVDEVRAAVHDGGCPGTVLDLVDADGGRLELAADREQLFRVLSNLALNAGQAGARTVTIAARRRDGRAVITVADDGPGLPDAVKARLFQPFAATARHGGSGLGLAIAHEIVRAHGGELSLAATGPAGTTFRIELPLAGLEAAA